MMVAFYREICKSSTFIFCGKLPLNDDKEQIIPSKSSSCSSSPDPGRELCQEIESFFRKTEMRDMKGADLVTRKYVVNNWNTNKACHRRKHNDFYGWLNVKRLGKNDLLGIAKFVPNEFEDTWVQILFLKLRCIEDRNDHLFKISFAVP